MVYRLSWVAGIGGVLLALLRLNRLLRGGVDGLPWQAVLLAAAVLGAAITWAGIAYRLDGRILALINLAAVTVTAVRIAVPATTWLIFPTLSSFVGMKNELEFAREVIRAGVAPVIPLAGLVAILAVLFWGLGALLSWGLLTGRPYLAVLTPLVVYLQFATMDRSPASWWLWLFLAFVGTALLAVALDRRREGTGLLTSPVTRLAIPRSLPAAAVAVVGVALLAAALATQAVAGAVPRTGVLEWRVRTGLTGEYYGGIAFNPFVGIHQGLVSQTNAPVFVAAVDGDTDPGRLSWRLLTLETFNGTQWFTDQPELRVPDDLDAYEDPDQAFIGPTGTVTQDITILALEMGWLPAAYSPVEMTADNQTVARGFQVKDDGSLRFGAITYRGMNYTVVSQVPEPDVDVLALGPDGGLSPVFAAAADDEAYTAADASAPAPVELEDPGRYLDLPSGLGAIDRLADAQAEGLTTDFEKALALESFFRSPGAFSYSTDIDPGHGAEDLVAWLTDPASPNYRTGYCEQFAAAMAVMARQLGIPSRVVLGFTPGELLDDGRVVVRDRNAHAWVELWMPTQGWVSFDPTPRGDGVNPSTAAGLPFPAAPYLDIPEPEAPPASTPAAPPVLPNRELDPEDLFLGGGSDTPVDSTGGLSIPPWVLWAAAGLAVAFGLVPGIKWARRSARMRRLARGDVGAAWRDMIDHLDDLGLHAEPTATPREVAAGVSDRMMPLAEVYGERVYGDPARQPASAVATASRSLADTRVALSMRYGRLRRLAALYRPASLLPRRLARRAR
ncbi:MAG: DUF3488 and transglutaminase-like domain-containing protein [Actinobacteria bacterium]|nr:DUF3488 and transglutaminase-like domain-containing protein [Actinomycetota bacterium]